MTSFYLFSGRKKLFKWYNTLHWTITIYYGFRHPSSKNGVPDVHKTCPSTKQPTCCQFWAPYQERRQLHPLQCARRCLWCRVGNLRRQVSKIHAKSQIMKALFAETWLNRFRLVLFPEKGRFEWCTADHGPICELRFVKLHFCQVHHIGFTCLDGKRNRQVALGNLCMFCIILHAFAK